MSEKPRRVEPLSGDPAQLTTPQLVEASEYCRWLILGGSALARIAFEELLEEHGARGTTGLLRQALARVARSVRIARTNVSRSPRFVASPQLQHLLRMIVNGTLTEEPPKQVTIAHALKKTEPGAGAVSAEISRLRRALSEYFRGPGLTDSVRLRVPVGEYVAIVKHSALPYPPGILEPVIQELAAPTLVAPLNGLPGISVFAAFSPGADRICFSWNHDSGGYNFDLFVQPLDGTVPTQITFGGGAADISPAWSPDGRTVAFLRLLRERAEVRLVNPDEPGSERKLVEAFPVRYEILTRQLAWSPDGFALAVVDKSAPSEPFTIFLVSIETAERRQLTFPPAAIVGDSDPAPSEDGEAWAFVRTEAVAVKDVFLQSSDRAAPIRLTSDRRHLYGLCWAPGGNDLICSSARTGVPALWRIGLAGETIEELPGINERALHPATSKSGRLAYSTLVMASSIWQLQLSSEANAAPTRLIHSSRNDVNPSFSPDGAKIAFASDRSGAFEIWTCDDDGKNPNKLTSFGSPAGAGSPRWSPDGRRIVFDSRADGNAHIYVLELSAGKIHRLTSGVSENVAPSWSADGKMIYFTSNRSGQHQIWRISTAGGDAIQMTTSGGFGPQESPDGQFVYYARSRTRSGLWRLPSTGGDEISVLESLKPMFWGLWSVTREGIYFMDVPRDAPPPCTLRFFDFWSGSVSDRALLPGMQLVHYQGLTLSPEGDRLLYPQLDHTAGEIMVIDSSKR